MTKEIQSRINPGDIIPGGFTFNNNATVSGDFLTLRDENGNPISGRSVSNGDRMTVLSVIQEKKLALVQYPTSSGVRQGYVTNAVNVIKYDNLEKWTNGSTTEYVYSAETGSERIGSLSPSEKATVLFKKGTRYNLVYNTSSGVRSKSGFVDYHGGISSDESTGSGVQPGDIVPEGFTYANNAVIENDFLYLRDENGNQIAGRTVSVGDKITVLDISYSKQLALVQYPTSSGVRQGYVTNSTSIIKYLNPYNWYNGSTAETVYLDATGNSTFGTVNPYEAATLLYKKDSRYHIVYDTSKGMLTKSGYINFKGLDAPASNITIPSISLSGVEKIQYGTSGNGRPLNAYKIGNGSKILFAGFAIHGFEDNWFRDGEALVKIATELVHKFASYNQTNGLHGWSIYIGQCMNPDGVIQGVTNNGPGRCAVTTGIDLNRSFPTGFVVRTDSRYKTGPNPLGAIEALSLKNFISDLHSKASEMVVIDGHGWLNCTYGNSSIASYFTRQFGFSYNGGAGGGFFARWAESLSNTRAVLVEYPSSTRSYNDVLNGNYIGKTYNAMLNIIRDNPGTGGGSGSGSNEEEYYKNAEVKDGTTAVNIRKGPSTNTEKLGTLAGRAKLDISRRVKPSGDSYYWYRIIFEGNYAYIREDFVTILSDAVGEEEFYKNAEVKAGTTAVNIRKGPSTNTEILGTLAGGAKLDISRRIKPSGDSYYWYRIIFEGKYAYIREDFVTILSNVVGEDYDTNENYHRLIELTKPFMKGADIKGIQVKLNNLGFNVGSEDGVYGYQSEAMVVKFQKHRGLLEDGVIGEITWNAIINNTSNLKPYDDSEVSIKFNEQVYDAQGIIKNSTNGLIIKKEPYEESEMITRIPNNSNIIISRRAFPPNQDYCWYKVIYNGNKGYVKENFVLITKEESREITFAKSGIVINTDKLDVRLLPTINSLRVGGLNRDSKIEIRSQITPKGENIPWYKIVFNSKFAYVKSSYIKIKFTSTENLEHKAKSEIAQVRKLFGFTHADPLAQGYLVLSHENPDGLITLESDATMYITPNVSKEYVQIYTNGEFSASLNDPTNPIGVELLGDIKSSQFGAGLRLFGGDVYLKVITTGIRWALKFELYKTWVSDEDENLEITASVTFSLTFDWIPDFPDNNLPPRFSPELALNYKSILSNLQKTINQNSMITIAILAAIGIAAIGLSGGSATTIIPLVATNLPILANLSNKSMS